MHDGAERAVSAQNGAWAKVWQITAKMSEIAPKFL